MAPIRIESIAAHRAVARARRIVHETDAETLADLVELVQIPAPPFGERLRAERMVERFRDAGLTAVFCDEVGNVLARLPPSFGEREAGSHASRDPDAQRRGTWSEQAPSRAVQGASPPVQHASAGSMQHAPAGPVQHASAGSMQYSSSGSSQHSSAGSAQPGDDATEPILLTAHLDTIFPEGTDVSIRRTGTRLIAPGVADDARGLVALLAIARALVEAGVSTRRPLIFVATVGEEGVGDLRGVKHLFRDGSPWQGAAGFITIEGTGHRRIVHRALGARRLRLTVRGPGGHSWVDWGTANPIDALGHALAGLGRLELDSLPHTTLNAGRIGGGTSVNAIPDAAWLELDLRSEDAGALADLEARVGRTLDAALETVNERRRTDTPPLTLGVELIGDRPTGRTSRHSALVEAARAATRYIGAVPQLVVSSTDANVPMALGIPAIAIGAGGNSGGAHTTTEWYSNEGGPEGIERALLTALAVTGLT